MLNPNSRLYLSVLTGGAYGNMGTAGTGEKVEIQLEMQIQVKFKNANRCE